MRFELEPYWDNIRPYPAYYFMACYLTLNEWNDIIKNFEEYKKGAAPRIKCVVDIEKLGKLDKKTYEKLYYFFAKGGTYIEIFHEEKEVFYV